MLTRKKAIHALLRATSGLIFGAGLISPAGAQPDSALPMKAYGRTLAESSPPVWPKPVKAPEGAPNILVIMTDDVGFGAASTFGGAIPTPTFDALANQGLRYTQFNTTAICSSTRASLLTGRNPQEVGIGYTTNWPTGYDGYNSVIPKSAGTIAQILKEAGYGTAMFGKGHITPEWEQSEAGPFDRWPTGLGFEYFYGFLGADTSMFAPTLIENTRYIDHPAGKADYHLDADLADHVIDWIAKQKAQAPQKPFFAYFAPGTAHAPNHAPQSWLAKFRGRFDGGWDRLRADIVARQKARGVIPKDTDDAPRPAGLPRWDDLNASQQHVFARYMEAYAASLAYADHEIGRVIEHLKRSGQFDNTLIVYIQGDNGASAEGSFNGKLFEQSGLNRVQEVQSDVEQRIEDIGTERSYSLIPGGWGWAMNAPFQWAKRYGSHFGGTRTGMVISWPKGIVGKGETRTQFHHVSDIMPTLLDAAGVQAPATLDGVPQQPIAGISMRYSFDHATEPSHRTVQVFGMAQNVAIYQNGWVAASRQTATPWDKVPATPVNPDERVWELYNVTRDFSEAHDLAATNPDKLAELKGLFWAEAARRNILPLHQSEGGQTGMPSLRGERREFVYDRPMAHLAGTAAPDVIKKSFSIRASVEVGQDANGVIVAHGGRYAGYSFFLKDGVPIFTYNDTPLHLSRVRAGRPISSGKHEIAAFVHHEAASEGGARVVLTVDGKTVAQGHVEHTMPTLISHTEGFDVGSDSVTSVDDLYKPEDSRFTGRLDRVVVSVEP